MSLSRVVLAPLERKELERRARSRALAVELVKRAKVILMLAAGRPLKLVSGSLALIVTSVFGRSALSKSDWSVWIRGTAAPSTDGARLRPKRAFWN
jgi:hypothetical protein